MSKGGYAIAEGGKVDDEAFSHSSGRTEFVSGFGIVTDALETILSRPVFTIIAAFGIVLLGAWAASPVQGHFALKGGKHCRAVSHAPRTDWASSSIKVKNLGCRKARRWLRRYKGSWRGVPWRDCKKRDRSTGDRQSGIAHTDYYCQSPNGRKKLVWVNT